MRLESPFKDTNTSKSKMGKKLEKKITSSGNSSKRSALKGVCEDKVSLHLSAHPQPRIIIKMI